MATTKVDVKLIDASSIGDTKYLKGDGTWGTVDALPSQTSHSGKFLTTDGSDASWATAGGLFSSYAVIADQKAAGTVGGTFTSGSWQTRDLNTEITDPDGIVSISTNAFTLAAGSYLIRWSAPGYRCANHKTRLYDVTGTASIQLGLSAYSPDNSDVETISNGSARVTPSGSNVYRLEHRCTSSSGSATYGFGRDAGYSEPEVYASVEIYKES